MGMSLVITLRFLGYRPMFHGRRDGGEPEWPPSPLRVFQALVAAAASRWRKSQFTEYARPTLIWFESLPDPNIVSPKSHIGIPTRLAVPNNDLDVVVAAWAKRCEPKKQSSELKTLKTVLPTHLTGDAVHYLYPLADPAEFARHKQTLIATARSITHLGWGVDMVAGNAAEMTQTEVDQLTGERWRPTADGSGTRLRVPRSGTLAALMAKHEAFLNRLGNDGFRPVPPLTAFDTVGYRRDTEPAQRPWVAFSILKPDASGNRAFDTPRRCRDVAAWVRHATATVCEGWPFGDTARFVHGHDETGNQLRGDQADERFMYLPLPSIERRGDRGEHVGSIRRVLIAAPPGFREQVHWIRRRLPGQELVGDGKPVGLLNLLPTSDWVLCQYTRTAQVWSTVTPVLLPGHDEATPAIVTRRMQAAPDEVSRLRVRERAEERTLNLLRRALLQAGLPAGLVEAAQLEWRSVGFRPGVQLTSRFAPLPPIRMPSYHVRVRWPVPVAGPLAVGCGRYRGYGLFAAESWDRG